MPRHARSCTTDSAFAESPKKWMRTNTPDPQYHNPYTSHQTINIIKLEGILFRNDIKKELWDCLKESLWDGEDLLQEGNILPSVLSRFSDTKGMKMDMQNLMTQLNVWVHSDDGDDLMSLEAFLAYLWNQRHLLCQPVIQIDPEFARFIMDQQEMAQAHFCTISKLPYHAQKFLIWSACGMDEDFYNLFYEHYDPITVGNTNNQDTYARIALKLGVRPKSLCLYSADEEDVSYANAAGAMATRGDLLRKWSIEGANVKLTRFDIFDDDV